jgi:co-chaperonin GroES (HSP10)
MIAQSDPQVEMFWDWCLLDVLPPGATKGGIQMPETVGQGGSELRLARVVAVGPGVPDSNGQLFDHGIRPGDHIYAAASRAMAEVFLEGKTYTIGQAQTLIMRLPRPEPQGVPQS